MYYLLLGDLNRRDHLIETLAEQNIHALFHYVPLHSSIAGLRFCRVAGQLPVTERTSDTLVRLPLWVGMVMSDVERVCEAVELALRPVRPKPKCAERQTLRRPLRRQAESRAAG